MGTIWFRDTLARRLFLLMWASLVISHLVAHEVVIGVLLPAKPTLAGLEDWRIPSLPPIPGVDDGADRTGPRDPGGRPPDEANRPDGSPPDLGGPRGSGPGGGQAIGLPTYALLVDYLIRITIIAVFSVLGARWLSLPIRRLVEAARTLATNLGQGESKQGLDESIGTVEVRQAASVFNTMAQQLTAQFRSRELLVAALSHDLRTPLTRIRIRLEPLPDSPEKSRSISDIREMNVLIDDSMEVFRTSSQTEDFRKTDLLSLSQSVVDDVVEQGAFASVSGTQEIVLARPMALKRVVMNLVNNAMRYAGNAVVTVARSHDGAEIIVEDEGPGIPPAMLEHVMEPFVRLETSRSRETGGTGLGLFIARDLTNKQGGKLTLSNRPSGGLRASIWLPHAR